MRAVLYHLIMGISSSVIERTHDILRSFAQIAYVLATYVSEEQSVYHQALANQAKDLNEIGLMQQILVLQKQAIENEDWEPEQLEELDNLAKGLVTIHGWKQRDIDRYMTQVIESGPEGYVYQSNGDSVDDGD